MLNKNNDADEAKNERVNVKEENLPNDTAATDITVKNLKEIHDLRF